LGELYHFCVIWNDDSSHHFIVVFLCSFKLLRKIIVSNSVKRAVVLMNLGSPASTEVKDVRDYLNEFLMDKRVIDYPYLSRLLLVRGIIVPFRAPKSAHAYKTIWTKEGSPLIVLTKQLRDAVSKKLDVPVVISMRYGQPSMDTVYKELNAQFLALEEVILLPLYPHYAMSSYETAVVQAQELHKKGGYSFKLDVIRPFYDEPNYIHALSESIRPFMNQEYDLMLFSYHGIPERHVQKSDPTGSHCLKSPECCTTPSPAHKTCYRHQCFTTTRLVAEQLSLPQGKFSTSFQSRLGRSEWLKPYTAKLLTELPAQGIKKLIILCPAFINDCLETLEEIAMEGRDLFLQAGGESFTLIPCLNSHPLLVDTIAGWIKGLEAGNQEMLLAS
jgi:ferrochelatase